MMDKHRREEKKKFQVLKYKSRNYDVLTYSLVGCLRLLSQFLELFLFLAESAVTCGRLGGCPALGHDLVIDRLGGLKKKEKRELE